MRIIDEAELQLGAWAVGKLSAHCALATDLGLNGDKG
jgi:hypothetical protein